MKPIFIALLITLFGFAMGLKNRECLNINSLNLLVKYFFYFSRLRYGSFILWILFNDP